MNLDVTDTIKLSDKEVTKATVRECLECDGTGIIAIPKVTFGKLPSTLKEKCPICKGTGMVYEVYIPCHEDD